MPPRRPSDGRSAPESALDALYERPLAEFVEARNALATERRKAGDAAGAAQVKALSRPTLSAWALNQVYWHARPDYDRLVAAGERLRSLQQQMLQGRVTDSRQAMAERQDAVRTVVERASEALAAHGPVTDAVRQRVAVTADALAAWGGRPPDYAPGRLTRDLDPPGFAALASLGPAAGPTAAPGPASRRGAAPTSLEHRVAPTTRALRLVQGAAAPAEGVDDERERARLAREAERAERQAAREREADERRRRARRQAAIRDAEQKLEAAQAALTRAASVERERAAAHRDRERALEQLRRQLALAENALAESAAALDEARHAKALADQAAVDGRSALERERATNGS